MDRENRAGNQKGRSDKKIMKSKAQRALHCAQTWQIKLRKLIGNAESAARGGDKRRLTVQIRFISKG
jgi:hypothetical protein